MLHETIAAIATPPGRGAIAIVRCSGPDARAITARVFRSRTPLADRVATYGEILDVDGIVLDRGLAIAMDAPRTVTGEDIVELHVHGSPVVARETLRALLHAGARSAGPGEFTRRAFLNGKLDLSAAEAVAHFLHSGVHVQRFVVYGAIIMEATDERMDDLNHRVDEGFERVDDRFERIETRFDRVDDRFERIETRFDATQRLIIQVGGGMIATMMVGFLSVIAIQL